MRSTLPDKCLSGSFLAPPHRFVLRSPGWSVLVIHGSVFDGDLPDDGVSALEFYRSTNSSSNPRW